MKAVLLINFIINSLSCIVAIHNETFEIVEITMDDFIPDKCRLADYRGMIVEEIDLKKTFVFPNGYEKQLYCSAFNSTILRELIDNVTNKAKMLQSNLICGAKIAFHNEGKVFNYNDFEQTLPCFAMITAPAYFYHPEQIKIINNTLVSQFETQN